MDVLAVTSVIVAGVGAASTGINAFYNTRRTAKTAKEGRAEQRAADGYLKVLSLAEQEAQWLDSRVHNLGLDQKELEYGVVSFMQVPKPAVTDRATAAALIATLASEPVHVRHVAWRAAADDLDRKMEDIVFYMTEDYPFDNVPDDWMKDLKENFQAKERAARQVLAEAVAHELGHRKPESRLRLFRR